MKKFKGLISESIILSRNIPGILFAIFISSLIMMNVLANKSIDTHLPFLALDCGFIFSWVTFLVMDIVVKHFGLRAANILTVIGLVTNLFFALMMLAASFIPGEWSQSYIEGSEVIINNAMDLTFRNTWYVLFGSSVAYLISAIINNYLNHYIGKKYDKDGNFRGFAVRSYLSTFFAQFIDNLLFAFIVSYHFFDWTIIQCITCALTGAIAELIFEVIFSPVAFKVCKHLDNNSVGKEYLDYLALKKEAKE